MLVLLNLLNPPSHFLPQVFTLVWMAKQKQKNPIKLIRYLQQKKGVVVLNLPPRCLPCNKQQKKKRQESVAYGFYVPIEIIVHTEEGNKLICRCYQMKDPVFAPPSPQYKWVICMGAKQNNLPAEYQKKLEAIETNNYTGPLPVMEEIKAAMTQTKKMTN
uniref:gamma-glutamylcyclotransferase n=1 Tax=Geotrypetes seraphini TaxID=260995 RepID=A0A6P8QF81_GEOSA|nr:gamma-glutamylcyclotransferase isoform X2 [Geotrypetes seraphini]